MGADLTDAVLKESKISACNFAFANFFRARMTRVACADTDFTEAVFTESRLRHIEASGCRFVKNSFFRADMAGMDFSACEFAAPTVSSPPSELRGVTVSAMQAAEIVGLLGVKVK